MLRVLRVWGLNKIFEREIGVFNSILLDVSRTGKEGDEVSTVKTECRT